MLEDSAATSPPNSRRIGMCSSSNMPQMPHMLEPLRTYRNSTYKMY